MARAGFDGATIDAIAEKAGVSPQTVYATFGSKRGIVAELLETARFGPGYVTAVRRARDEDDPERRLRGVAGVARQIFEAERHELDLLRGAGAVSPELAALERSRETGRYDSQAAVVEFLAGSGRLKPALDVPQARDILWTLTARETFRLLVVERGWPPSRYQAWLGDLLVSALLGPAPKRRRAPSKR
jgi:AcrR family transcriptional regulator